MSAKQIRNGGYVDVSQTLQALTPGLYISPKNGPAGLSDHCGGCRQDPLLPRSPTGALLASFDSNARWHRWLHQGVHTLDFTAALRRRPHWDVLMIVLLLGAGAISVTGAVLGIRRLCRTLGCRQADRQ